MAWQPRCSRVRARRPNGGSAIAAATAMSLNTPVTRSLLESLVHDELNHGVGNEDQGRGCAHPEAREALVSVQKRQG